MDKSTNNTGKDYTATPVQAKDMKVQDRKTGEFYDPKAAFDNLMAREDIIASMKRLKVR